MISAAKPIDQLSRQELDRLIQSLRKQKATGEAPLGRRRQSGAAPLSFAQRRLWFLEQLAPGTPLYTIAGAVDLDGPLDAAALAGALDAIVRRHETLRTAFAVTAGEPLQVVAAPFSLGPPRIDLTALPPAARHAEAERVAAAAARRPFDLTRPPLARALLLKAAEREHTLLLVLHHTIADGWSLGVLLRDLVALYGAAGAGRRADLPPLAIQYGDFAQWERDALQGETRERLLAYWRRRLADLPPPLALPADRPRPARPSSRGGQAPIALPAGLSRAIEALARRRGFLPFMVLLAALDTLLHRYSGETDLLVGSVLANRRRAETEDLIGFFANTIVLRGDLAGDPTAVQLLDRVGKATLEDWAHQELPFDVLAWELLPRRGADPGALLQVMLVLQTAAPAEAAAATAVIADGAAGLAWRPRALHTGTAKFDLTLDLAVRGGRLEGSLEYRSDLFEAATVARLAQHYHVLLAAIVEDPERRLGELPLLAAPERHQLLTEWRGAASAYPRESTVDELFAGQAACRPEAVAVSLGAERLTYGGLDARANRLARHLRRLGVRPEDPVGLYLDRSPDMIVALVAILKSGGAYLPLDRGYPRQRLALLLAQTGAPIVVTREALHGDLPLRDGTRALCLDADKRAIAAESAVALAPVNDPASLAYVMFTSGSTGEPKGVGVSHRAVVRLVRGTGYASFGPGEVFLHVAPIAFDASTFEIWGSLLNGGRLALFPAGPVALAELGDVATREGVTALWLTAGLFHALIDKGAAGLGGLRQLLAGGDVLSPPHVRRALERLPGCVLINGYGPTENTTFTCCHCMTRPEDVDTPVAIGRPIANSSALVVDRAGQPSPAGVPGELHAGGDGLARGYFGRPDLTAERFTPDPFGAPGGRVYRTGDLARCLPDGRMELLGRIDQQVKIRGFRIEPGEVEAVLAGHPGVAAAAVVPYEPAPGDRRLAAYVVFRPGWPPVCGELHDLAAERLPAYMVPAAFVTLAALPLTANGKVDRRSLPPPGVHHRAAGAPVAAPRNPTEELLVRLWAELLDLGPGEVSVEDDFFALGGHSLLAMRLASRIQEDLRVDLALHCLFDAPTPAALARVILAARQGAAAAPILPLPRTAPLPLSFGQERLWFLAQLDPGSAAYTIAAAERLRGRLCVPALAASLSEIVRRHEALRTTFAAENGSPVQRIAAPSHGMSALPEIDLRALAPDRRQAAARLLIAAASRRSFDLESGPLLWTALFRLGDEERLLLLTLHHIVADGWSMGVLVAELSALYAAIAAGAASPLPELPVQVADAAVWQRRMLGGEALAPQLAYWRRQLAGATLLELPADRPARTVRSTRGASLPFTLSAALRSALEARAHRERATLFMVLLGALQALLARYSGQDDVAVGTAIAHRNRPELAGLIGFFVNTLVLRTDLGGEPDRRELIRRCRETALDAYAHQDLPFEKLVEELAPQRDLSHPPLFRVLLTLQNAPLPTLSLPGIAAAPEPIASRTAKLDLTLSLAPDGEGLGGWLEYATDLFDAVTAQRLLAHFERLLAGLAADTAAPENAEDGEEPLVAALPLLSPAERMQMLREWNDTGAGTGHGQCLHELVAAQAVATPGAPAVVCGMERLTYRELDRRANRLAQHLVALGVTPETLVGVCLDSGPELVPALLGILKAGAAYVPLDPAYPTERLAFILEDARVPVLVTQAALAPRFAALAACVLVDADRPLLAAVNAAEPRTGVDPDNLAYVIYTSGSTGRPKGVAITHRSAAAFVRWAPDADLAGVLAATSICFDLSIFELFVPLSRGGTVLLAENALALPALPAASEVTLINTVPSAMVELVRLGPPPPRLRAVNLAGEPLQRSLVRDIERWCPEARVTNLYGPSEDTTYSTWAGLDRGDERAPAIGRPVGGTTVYLLDRRLDPVPLGAAGEIFLAGSGLARGYLGRAELTAARFLPDPFAQAPGGRLYATGDLARFRPDGNLEFRGRRDHQVKIRGFRIELGEIEAALVRHPDVGQAVVVVRDEGEDRRLVAYLTPVPSPIAPPPPGIGANLDVGEGLAPSREGGKVPSSPANPPPTREGASPSPTEDIGLELAPIPPGEGGQGGEALRAFLARQLPAHMVPGAFVVLAALPLSPNGKVDRRALPSPAGPETGRSYAAPRSPLEELVAAITAAVLGVERVGIEDNFFDLGGHSLLATRLVSRLRGALAVDLPVRQLFETPTVATLAAVIAGRRGEPREAEPPIVRIPRAGALPLSFSQERLWFLDKLQPESATYNMPVAVRLRGALAPALLARSLNASVHRHEILRTTFGAAHGEPFQRIAPALAIPLPLLDLRGLAGPARQAELGRRIGEDCGTPFDLERGPLLRSRLFRLGEEDWVLLVNLHHIVADGWSLQVLVREIARCYAAFAAGEPPPLPDLAVQYVDFAGWQRRWLQGEALERHLDYWRRQLSGVLPVLDLPADRLRPPVQTFRGGTRSTLLASDLGTALRALGRRQDATLFMALFTAFNLLLQRYSGQDDVLVGIPIAGRNRAQVEDLIGFFVNSLVLRTDFSGEPAFDALLARVRQTALDAYTHQDLPFERLLQELRPERDLSRTPLFQVYFNFQSSSGPPASLPGLTLESLANPEDFSKFDLTLYVLAESDGAIRLDLVYNACLFSADRIGEMLAQYTALLAQAAARPEAAIGSFSLLTAQALRALPDPTRELDAGWIGPVHQHLSAWAARAPSRPAVTDAAGTWSYGDLAEQSNRLAHLLLSAGIGKEEVVAIYAHRSATLVWAVLGALKAGAAFTVLDPTYPAARTVEILRLARPRAWLAMTAAGAVPEPLASFVAELPGCLRLELAPWQDCADGGPLAAWPADDPGVPVGPDDLAYLAFTSGSTGIPKGILGRHGPLSHFLPWQCAELGLSGSDRFSLLSGLAHDPLQRDLFTPLYLGATICIPDPVQIVAPGWLSLWMRRQGVSVAHLTPAMGQLLTEGGGGAAETLEALRYVFLVGDVLTHRDVARLQRLAPGVTIVNLYGSTETQRAVGYHVVPPAAPVGGTETPGKEVLPLGRGMQDVQLLVLSRAGQLAGIGEIGEIAVRSPHLARGYLGDEAGSAARFVASPFTARPEDRLYRTGDLGRYLPDGEVAFAGRADTQVKVRGFRIELGEIESHLGRASGVREAVVLASEDGGASRRLLACVVAEPGPQAALSAGDLRRRLKEMLPAYMVPSAFVLLPRIPLTPNGKIDRRELLRLATAQPEEDAGYRAPQTRAEAVIAGILREVLAVDRVGSDDNFFDLGGNSLLLVQVQSRLQAAFHRELPVFELFSNPTVAALARHLAPPAVLTPAATAPADTGAEKLSAGRERLRRRFRQSQESGETPARRSP